MFKKVIVLLFMFSLAVTAQEKKFNILDFYPIDNSHSYIDFSIKYMGYANVKGRFEKFSGLFKYDEHDITKTSISLSIVANSIDTDNDRRDKDLKSENWFESEKFSSLTFVSTKSRKTNTGFEIIGDLTIKGITKEIVIKMNPASGVLKDIRGDSQVIISGETVINRTDFGVEGKNWSAIKEGITGVGDEVKIEVSILGKQVNLANLKSWVSNETKAPGKIYKEIINNDLEQGLKLFDEMLLDTDTKLNSNTLNINGRILLKEGKIKEALEVFEKNIKTYPNDYRVYNSYAEALAVSGNLTEAKKYYKKALKINSNNQIAIEILRHLE